MALVLESYKVRVKNKDETFEFFSSYKLLYAWVILWLGRRKGRVFGSHRMKDKPRDLQGEIVAKNWREMGKNAKVYEPWKQRNVSSSIMAFWFSIFVFFSLKDNGDVSRAVEFI